MYYNKYQTCWKNVLEKIKINGNIDYIGKKRYEFKKKSYESIMLIIQNIIYAYVVDWRRHLLNRLYSDSRQYLVSFRDKQEVHNKSIEVKYSQI